MLAARDQENLVYGHQAAAASKPLNQSNRTLQPKTPGNKFPKTPLKIPLNDENAPTAFGGKSGKGKGLENLMTGGKQGSNFDKNGFVTPVLGMGALRTSLQCTNHPQGARTRAPLGMKTTNAKAKAIQTPAPHPQKEAEKSQPKQTTGRRQKKVIHADAVRLEVHGDESPLADRDVEVEYAPPRPKDIPYQSEDFPENCLNLNPLKPGNLMRGRYSHHHNRLDENGLTRLERELEESYIKSANEADERFLKTLEEEQWTVGDVPETFRHLRKKKPDQHKAPVIDQPKRSIPVPNRAPATISSRNAASALSVMPKTSIAHPRVTQANPKRTVSFLSRPKPKPAPLTTTNPSSIRNTAATAASKSTIGYSKGRSASGAMQKKDEVVTRAETLQKRTGGMMRSVSNMSQGSDTTITPARFVQKQGAEDEEWKKRLAFLSAFDVDDEDLEPGLRGALPECLRKDEDDEEFVLTLGDGSV
ncbi:Uncharacterized protein BP5553_01339 [Venustampulla echinocandica]|uniref:Uncharacterized protein n=1 Tax=Venustampulla echinocandica TaxID=2656787 RepID=A0A370U0P7_9HELO|nr:Uncharacterized protein BP5553_01339 [Venustampulla echinocandica]RDL41360.1 Uncharacterized protein BP5553_01339 [Venustampulla echinocandica]